MSNNEMISFSRELSNELAELLAEKARVCGGGAFEIWEEICDLFGTQAQYQDEPVQKIGEAWSNMVAAADSMRLPRSAVAWLTMLTNRPAPASRYSRRKPKKPSATC